MYIPEKLKQDPDEVLHEFIKDNPFAALVFSPSSSGSELEANHLPFELIEEKGKTLRLRAHVSRENPLWKMVAEKAAAKDADIKENEADVLVIFSGAHSYISPAWMPGRHTHKKVAPSWNYSAVHVYGKIEVCDDPKWMLRHLHGLTTNNEADLEDPWKMAEAAAGFLKNASKYIVGLEITVDKLVGKTLASQQYSTKTKLSIIEGLRREKGQMGEAVANVISSQIDTEQQREANDHSKE